MWSFFKIQMPDGSPGSFSHADAQSRQQDIKRLNREIRRRTRMIGTFPDGNSAMMLVCAKLRHAADNQLDSRKFMNRKPLEAALEDTFIAS